MQSTIFINGLLGLSPVIAFLALLTQFDSFKLVRRGFVLQLIAAGAIAALAAALLSKGALDVFNVGYDAFIRYGAPVLEEVLKAIIVFFLIRTNRIGFAVDAVIAGFAIGAGFALMENYFYLQVIGTNHSAEWVVRGFGTAIMHGGTAAIIALSSQLLTSQKAAASLVRFLPGLIAAILLHAAFNQFRGYPVASTLVMMLGLAGGLGFVLLRGRRSIDRLLDVNFEQYRALLGEIQSGAFSENTLGGMLKSLRLRLDPSETADIVRYAELHTELILLSEEALKAQGAGQQVSLPDSVAEKLGQLHYLEERLGRSVRLALAEHLPFSRKDFFQLYKLARDGAKPAQLDHDFNSDLLLDEEDRSAALAAFPNIAFALDHPALRTVFAPIDDRANQFKTKSRRRGVRIVLIATVALFVSTAHTLFAGFDPFFIKLIAACGILAISFALLISYFGINGRNQKKRWLADRLASERLRQFHFQHFALHAADIIDSVNDKKKQKDYARARDQRFSEFRKSILDRNDEELHRILLDQDYDEGMLTSPPQQASLSASTHLDEYFKAYATLRFDRQLNYCNHVLRESRGFLKPSIVRQAQILGSLSLAALGVLLLLQAGVFIGIVTETPWLTHPIVSIATMWAALTALAAQTIRGGLQPDRQIERMRQFRNALRRNHYRFRQAEEPETKITAMLEMEKICFDEIVLFLKSNHEAEFVL